MRELDQDVPQKALSSAPHAGVTPFHMRVRSAIYRGSDCGKADIDLRVRHSFRIQRTTCACG